MTPRVSSSPAAVRALRRVYRHPPNAAYRPLTVPRNGTSGKETRADHDFARGSKGKEFHHVYLIGLAEEQLPSFHAVRSGPAAMEEERRNCFVAITRVQSTLTLTHADSYFGRSKQPSRFLQDMGLRSGDTAC